MVKPEADIVKEIQEQRPAVPVGLLSRQEKDRLIERGVVGLYRWYTARSQASRNWHPDRSFDWRALRTDHSADLNRIFEGFFAVEQFVPDYTSEMIRVARSSHGRAYFQIRWGSEEEKHADLWQNVILFSRFRPLQWLEDYKWALREKRYTLPWDDALHMLFYALVQERATEVNYLNTALVATGKSEKPELAQDRDAVLARLSQTIAVDEAAHFAFFLELARLYLYYYPGQALEALADVVKHFVMPAMDLVPDFPGFYEAVYRTGIYGHARHYGHDVLQVVLDHVGVAGRRALVSGVKRLRQVPDPDGNSRDTAIFEVLDYGAVQHAVKRLFARVEDYEQEVGIAEVDPTRFVASGLVPPAGQR